MLPNLNTKLKYSNLFECSYVQAQKLTQMGNAHTNIIFQQGWQRENCPWANPPRPYVTPHSYTAVTREFPSTYAAVALNSSPPRADLSNQTTISFSAQIQHDTSLNLNADKLSFFQQF